MGMLWVTLYNTKTSKQEKNKGEKFASQDKIYVEEWSSSWKHHLTP